MTGRKRDVYWTSTNDVYRHHTMMLTGIKQWCWQDIELWCLQASNNDVDRHQTMIDQTLNNDWEITWRWLVIEWWCLLTPKKARPDTKQWLGNTAAPKSRCWTPRSIVFTVRQNQSSSGNHGLNRADRVTSFDVISISVRRKHFLQYRTTGEHCWSDVMMLNSTE